MLRLRQRPRYDWIWLALAACVAAVLLYVLSPILAPFLAAAILAYILDPIVDKFEQRGAGRTVGTMLAMLLLIVAIILGALIVIPLFYKESLLLSDQVPKFVDTLRTEFSPWLQQKLGIQINLDFDSVRQFVTDNLQDAKGIAQRILASLRIGGLAVLGFVVNLLLIPVVLFYLLRDWRLFLASLDDAVPRRWHVNVRAIASDIDKVLSEFLRGQLSVMLIMSVFYVVALSIAGLQFALPIGLITGLLVFIPYLGSGTGLILSTVAAFMQFQALPGVLGVWAVFGIGQALEGMVVTPWLVGDRIGLHPVAVIFALLAFGQIFGFFGVLLALPASAALLVALRHLRARYRNSALYR